jgi:hypothetical protein
VWKEWSMSILIKGMRMPTTGLYFVSVDNTDGRDKTIVTVERMLGNRDGLRAAIRQDQELRLLPPGGCQRAEYEEGAP